MRFIAFDRDAVYRSRGMKVIIKTAARTSRPATTYSPADVLPVRSISQPTANGPSQPERFPIELISAMPPAAALPVNSVVGICQNGENALSTPVTPSTSAANASAGWLPNAPMSTRQIGRASCREREEVLEE